MNKEMKLTFCRRSIQKQSFSMCAFSGAGMASDTSSGKGDCGGRKKRTCTLTFGWRETKDLRLYYYMFIRSLAGNVDQLLYNRLTVVG